MVFAQFAEQHVEGDGFYALSGKFVDEAAIDLSRPVQPKVVAHLAAFHGVNGFIVNAGEAEVGGNLGIKMQSGARTPVVGHAFEAFKEIHAQSGGDGHEQDDTNRDESGDFFERLGFHLGELNKKTRAPQGRSGFLKALDII